MTADKFTIHDLFAEEWRDIPGYEGCYQVSSIGRVRSVRRSRPGRLMKLSNRRGYRQVGLTKDDTYKAPPVHRLVLAAFVGPSKLQVNHIDCDKANNRLENLEYCTPQENIAHAIRNDRFLKGDKSPSRLHPERLPRGENNKQAKLTERQVREIRNLIEQKVRGPKIARAYGISAMTVTQIKYRRIWAHVE